MKFFQTYKLEPSFFKDVDVGTEYTGKLKGFRPAKDYWIGVCNLKDITKQTDTEDILLAAVEFIYCKKPDNTLNDLLNLKQQVRDIEIKLTLKGFTRKGYPIFYHNFVPT